MEVSDEKPLQEHCLSVEVDEFMIIVEMLTSLEKQNKSRYLFQCL